MAAKEHKKIDCISRVIKRISCTSKAMPVFHMISTDSDTSLRQAQGHIRDCCDKWKHLQNDVADHMEIEWESIRIVEMSSTFLTVADQSLHICRLLRARFLYGNMILAAR